MKSTRKTRSHSSLVLVLLKFLTPEIYTTWGKNKHNNNNNHGNVYGAIIMTKVTARVHPVHLMNVD